MGSKSKRKFTTVSIPRTLFDKIKVRIKETGFSSVSDYVINVLQELVSEEEKTKAFSKKDEEKVRARLKSLGYFE